MFSSWPEYVVKLLIQFNKEVKTMLILLSGNEDKIKAIKDYMDTYSLESEDIIDMIYSEIFKVEE